MIRFACPQCQKKLKASTTAAGRMTSCPKCGHHLAVPTSDEADAAPQVDSSPATIPPIPLRHERTTRGNDEPWIDARAEFVDINAMKGELAAIPWAQLNPLVPLWRDRLWSLVWVQFLTFAFCTPLVVAVSYREGVSLEEAAWAFSLYFAIVWAVFLHRCLQPDRLRKRTLLAIWCTTAFLGVLAVNVITLVGQFLPGLRTLFNVAEFDSFWGRWIHFTVAVGSVEEAAKAIPVVWMTYRLKPGFRATTPMYLGALSGLAFGATEALVYSLSYAMAHDQRQISSGAYLVVQVLRFVSLPLLHAVWCAIFGYVIGVSATHREGAHGTLLVGLTIVALLHGTYDALAGSWGAVAVGGLSLLLFVCYVRQAQTSALSGEAGTALLTQDASSQ